jgi:drug/metabolite transporter (DMT)-like permease
MGIVELIAVYVYMKMHANSHLSISAIISRTRLIWVPFFAFLFFGEHFTLPIYIGMGVLLAGLMVASSPHKLFVDKGITFAYLSAFIIGINAAQMKMNTPFASPSVLLIFLTFPTSIILPFAIKRAKKEIPHFFKDRLGIKIAAGAVNIISIYTFTLALKTGPVSIINAIYQATMIFAVLAGIFILGEKEDMRRKLFGTGVALIGILVLSFSGI